MDAKPCGVLVLGGGPTGFCTAMMLAERGHKDIVVLDRAPSAQWYDSTKAYMYNLDWRGKLAMTRCGVPSVNDAGLTLMEKLPIWYINADGSIEFKRAAFGNTALTNKDDVATWMSRHQLTRFLYSSVQDKHSDAVSVHYDARVENVSVPRSPGEQLTVHMGAHDGEPSHAWAPKLLVAADGARSVVSRALQEAYPGEGYESKEALSDSGGLAFKILTLPPNPSLVKGRDPFPNDQSTVCVGVPVGGDEPIRIGLLPNRDLQESRSANFILWPDHPFFKIRDPEALFTYLEQGFPLVDFRGIVSQEEATRFVNAKVGQFPHPQYCERVFRTFPDAALPDSLAASEAGVNTAPGSAVVLMGDAIHSFPPDLGQGVNAAVADVAALQTCLDAAGTDYGSALSQFEAKRVPESAALIRMMQIGFPYQYKQARKKAQNAAWMLNAVTHLVLNKVAPFAFAPLAIQMLTSASGERYESYDEIMRIADNTTRNITALAVVLVAVAGSKAAGVW